LSPFAAKVTPNRELKGMSDSVPPTPSTTSVFSDERQMAMIIYILFLVGFPTLHMPTIVGLVLAYVNRDGAPEWLRSHYTFQIRTFWIGLLYFCVAGLCTVSIVLTIVGIPMLIAAFVWYVVRCAMGISRLLKSQAYPTPESWIL
jgi:uncharacterized membrane protein